MEIALNVSMDWLVFGEHDSCPGADLRGALKATDDLESAGQAMIKQLIEAVLVKRRAPRSAS